MSPSHCITSDTSNAQPSHFQEANALYLTNDGASSFITLNYLEKLHAARFGSDKTLPEIDASTEVQLRSRFADSDETRVTTHRILYTARYDIIFIKHDWERPVQQCLTRLRSKQSRKQRHSSRRRRAHKQDGAQEGL
ncbi:hypothetical protein N0V84_010881 [Fusarium piperis]|uniref:Uncharacterized protein n=1 Tax=Fusarium piperis TaxID=1435070 RepID=A0A9W8TEN1_9HYPO|nr:hypothetical protein N0V84_010881 [Fusarium piperis]